MSLASPSVPSSTAQARADFVGYLALICTGKRLPLQVRHSVAGHYIGTADEDGPVSRESVEYFCAHRAARHALATGRWQQRLHP